MPEDQQDTKLENFFSIFGESITFMGGQTVISPDKDPDGVYYILKGYIQICAHLKTEQEKVYAIYKKGEIFPLLWALSGIKKNLYYHALNNTELYRIPKEKFTEYITRDPVFLSAITIKLTSLLNIFVDRVDNLTIPKASSRIIARLLFFADRFGVKIGEEIVISLPMNHSYIANSIAMTRETVNRELQKLIKKGLISYRNKLLVIKNKEHLLNEMMISGLIVGFGSLVEMID